MSNSISTRKWFQVSIFNFSLLALFGVILRYKISFPLPEVNQKYLLNAHSNFAFSGWVSLSLMIFLIYYLQHNHIFRYNKIYKIVLYGFTFSAYGMLISFILLGYSIIPITLMVLSILFSYIYIVCCWRDLSLVKDTPHISSWFKTGLILWGISSIGTFALAYLMYVRYPVKDFYLSAMYFFLHFQYNGWFIFVCMGVLFYLIGMTASPASMARLIKISRATYLPLAISAAPTFLLSIIWMELPFYLNLIAWIFAIVQLVAILPLTKVLKAFYRHDNSILPYPVKLLFLLSTATLTFKITLQFLSMVPFLSHIAFGSRAIIIGYLHLSFVGIISFFLLGFIQMSTKINFPRFAIYSFIFGFVLQELVLLNQGLQGVGLFAVPHPNEILFSCAIIMWLSLVIITISFVHKSKIRTATESAEALALEEVSAP